MRTINYFLILLFTFFGIKVNAQTLIMNEVSNGPTGNQEYVEFVVASNTVTYSCTNSTPPCIDIRGWIFDDNSGYHGSAGIAAGAIRFSQSPVWACVPLGTIILIYNDADRNPAIPPDDISMSDGNCKIIAPISDATLFESNATTPGASACSYPATGWVAGGNWSNTLLANPGDCARIVNLAGCEVFSVCWGTDNQNNLIYFTGAGGQKVFFFNDNNPTLQANWTSGSASPSPGLQTPGAPNNAANAAYIGQFNNNCAAITPVTVIATSVNAGCTCNGSATASASGSIPGYTYAWYDASNTAIGQTSATATNLCPGVYYVVASSHIGCADTATVTIGSTSSAITVGVNSSTICAGTSVTLTANPSAAGGTYSWTPGGQTTQTIVVNPSTTTSYSVTYTLGGCSGTNTSTVTVGASPTITLSSSSPSLCASGQTATLTLTGSAGTYSWSNGASTQTTTISSPGIYTATLTTAGCGTVSSSITIGALPSPTISISAPSSSVCAVGAITLTANSSNPNYAWSNGATTQTVSVSTASISVTTTNSCGSASDTYTLTVVPSPTVSVTPNAVLLCTGQSATVQAGANTAVTYSWSTGATTSSVSLNATGVYTVTATNACGNSSGTVSVNMSSASSITISASQGAICSGETATLSISGSTGTYSWSNGANTSTITITSPGVYTATVTTPNCGTAISSISIGSLPLPTVSIVASSPSVCAGSNITLTANSSSGNYSWSNGSTAQTTSSGSPTISVTSTNSCGPTTVTYTLLVIPIPTVAVTPNSNILCPGYASTLTATSNVNNYQWSTGATTNVIQTTTPGVNSVTVSNACGTATASAFISLLTIPPLTLTASSNSICPGETATLTVTGGAAMPGNPIAYNWSNSTSTASVVTTTGGVVTVSNTNVCGTITSSINVAIYNVNASFSANPSIGVKPLIVTFTNNSSGANSYAWSFGNGNTASTQTVIPQTYTLTGDYMVYLMVSNGSCSDIDSLLIRVLNEEPGLTIPNVFTPNGDHANDVFRVSGYGITEFSCVIYNRWGTELFSWSDINQGWDGSVNGQPASNGTYFFIITAKDLTDKEIKKQGTVNLFK